MPHVLRLSATGLALILLTACAPRPFIDDMGIDTTAPVPAPLPAAPKERLVQAIEENGCAMTATNVAAILLRANLTQAALPPLISELNAEGRAEAADAGMIRILSDNCI